MTHIFIIRRCLVSGFFASSTQFKYSERWLGGSFENLSSKLLFCRLRITSGGISAIFELYHPRYYPRYMIELPLLR